MADPANILEFNAFDELSKGGIVLAFLSLMAGVFLATVGQAGLLVASLAAIPLFAGLWFAVSYHRVRVDVLQGRIEIDRRFGFSHQRKVYQAGELSYVEMRVFPRKGGVGFKAFAVPAGAGDRVLLLSLAGKTPTESLLPALRALGIRTISDGGSWKRAPGWMRPYLEEASALEVSEVRRGIDPPEKGK